MISTLKFSGISPTVSEFVGETQWASTWYTGDADYVVDGDPLSWYDGLGSITFAVKYDLLILQQSILMALFPTVTSIFMSMIF